MIDIEQGRDINGKISKKKLKLKKICFKKYTNGSSENNHLIIIPDLFFLVNFVFIVLLQYFS